MSARVSRKWKEQLFKVHPELKNSKPKIEKGEDYMKDEAMALTVNKFKFSLENRPDVDVDLLNKAIVVKLSMLERSLNLEKAGGSESN